MCIKKKDIINNANFKSIVRKKFKHCRKCNVLSMNHYSDVKNPFNLLYDYYARFKDADY